MQNRPRVSGASIAWVFNGSRSKKLLSLLALTSMINCAMIAFADPPPAVEAAGLRFARHDLVRARAAETSAKSKASEAATLVQNLEAGVKSATEAKTGAEAAVASALTAVKAAETALITVNKALEEAKAAVQKLADDANADPAVVEVAKKQVEAATAAVATATETLKAAQADQATAAAKVVEATKAFEKAQAELKVAIESGAALDKDLAAIAPIVAAATAKVALYEAATPKADPAQIHLVSTYKHDRPFMSCQIHPSGDLVYAGSQDNSIQRWDLLFGTKTSFVAHRSWVKTLAFDAQSHLMVSGSYAGELKWWDTETGSAEPIRSINAHKGYLRGAAFSRDSKLLATAGNDLVIRIWSTADGALVKELAGHERHIYNLAFHPDGRSLISGDLMGIVKHWDLENWELVRNLDASALTKYDPTFRADCGGVRCIEFSPDGRFLAVGGIGEVTNAFAGVGKPTVILFDWLTGQAVHKLNPKANFVGSVFSLKYHDSGDLLIGAGGGSGGAIWFWKPDQGESIQDFALPNVAYDMAMHPDGLRLTVALYDSTIRVYDLGPKLEAKK